MKFIYPAVFSRTEEGTYTGRFPDLEGAVVYGETLEETVDEANQAASDWITAELMEEEAILPPVSDTEDIPLKSGEIIRNICVTIRFYEGWDE